MLENSMLTIVPAPSDVRAFLLGFLDHGFCILIYKWSTAHEGKNSVVAYSVGSLPFLARHSSNSTRSLGFPHR